MWIPHIRCSQKYQEVCKIQHIAAAGTGSLDMSNLAGQCSWNTCSVFVLLYSTKCQTDPEQMNTVNAYTVMWWYVSECLPGF